MYDQNQIKSLRNVFHVAITIPMNHLDGIWKKYEEFENLILKQNAKTFLSELSQKYKSAVNKLREKKMIRDFPLPNILSRPPSGLNKHFHQLRIWKQLIDLEKKNTQRLSQEELIKRVNFVYEQTLCSFLHYEDVWIDYTQWLISQQQYTLCDEVFERACAYCLPDGKQQSLLLHFAYIDFVEMYKRDIPKCKELYEKLLEKRQDPIVYIHYGRFLRKNETSKSARNLFVRATQSATCTYHIYTAVAMDEFNDPKNKEGENIKVAKKIFEKGLEKYSNDPNFVLSFISFLEYVNDKNNARVLFEKILNSGSQLTGANHEDMKKGLKEVWNRFIDFEKREGDLTSLERLERRRDEELEVIDKNNKEFRNDASRMIERKRYMDLWPGSAKEIKMLEWSAKVDEEIHQLNVNPNMKKKDREGEVIQAALFSTEFVEQYKQLKKKMVKPDLSQMTEINVHSLPSMVVDPTGFAIPEAIVKMIHLATSINYAGPFPDLEFVIDSFRKAALPTSASTSSSTTTNTMNKKRSRNEMEEESMDEQAEEVKATDAVRDEDDEDDFVNNVPGRALSMSDDIYKKRKQMKLQKM